jgi:hypothetical protein
MADYSKSQFVPHSKNFLSGFPVYGISGTSRCFFWDKYKTNKRSVGRT